MIAPAESCNGSAQCATVRSIRFDPSIRLAFLYLVIDAIGNRGKTLTFHAMVRVDDTVGSVARLLVRVHRVDCTTSFRHDMGNHPITSGTWAAYEIKAPIAIDARDIEFGTQLVGQGAAWSDNTIMTFAGP